MTTTQNNVAAQAGDEPMRAAFESWLIAKAQSQRPGEPLTDKEKAFVIRRSVWDKNSYEGRDDAWQSWKAAHAVYVSPRATADVERDAARYRFIRNHPKVGGVLVANLMVGRLPLDESIDAAIATTKPGA